MDATDPQPATLARLASLTALVLAALFIASILLGPGGVLHGDPDAATALAFAAEHGRALALLGLLDGLINTLFGVLIVLLIALAGKDGVLACIAYISAGAAMAIQWTHAGMLYALGELAQRGGADAGVLALFALGSTMDDADGIVIPLAMVCAGWLLLRSQRAPAFIGWLTLVVAGIGMLQTLVAALGGPDAGPVTVLSAWIWLVGTGIALLVRPVSHSASAQYFSTVR